MKKNSSVIHKLVIGVLVIILILSGVATIRGYIRDKKAAEEYEKLAEIVQTTSAPSETEVEITTEGETKAEVKNYVSPVDFNQLKGMNPDTIGWIKIEDTNIDYPIVQTTDNDKYLHTDFDGNESIAGTVYLDFESDPDMAGRNNILYGHNMKNGSMFKDVVKYKNEEFFKNHQYFSIYTPEKEICLKVVAAYYGEAKPIARKTKFKTQESFDAFVKEMLEPCTYAEIPKEPISSIYTLITCSYEINDARTFLFAVPVDEEGKMISIDPLENNEQDGK